MDAGESMDRQAASPLVTWLIHPVTLLGIVVLVGNDHLLKPRYPGPVTGKLSDLAGLAVAPPLLALVLAPVVPRRSPVLAARAALVLTAACFVAVKTSPVGAQVASAAWSVVSGPSVVLADRTDLIALSAVGAAAWAWTRARRRRPLSVFVVRRISVLVVLPAAALAVAGTTAPQYPDAVAVGTWRGMFVAGEANVFDRDRQPDGWRLSDDGRAWRSMTDAEWSAFKEERPDRNDMARQRCVPDDPARCYRIVPDHLRVLESVDGGATWSTSWEVPDGRRTYLARQHRVLRPGEIVAYLSAQAVAVLPVRAHAHLVVVANGPDGFAVRDASGRWERVGFGTVDDGYENSAEPLYGDVWTIVPEAALAALVGLLVLGVAGWRVSVARARRITGWSWSLMVGLLTGLGGAAGLASPQESLLDLAYAAAMVLGIALSVIGAVGLIWPWPREPAGRRSLPLVLVAALLTAGAILATFWAWMDGLLVDYRAATMLALVVALAGTSLGGRLAGRPPGAPSPVARSVPPPAGASPPAAPPRLPLRPAGPAGVSEGNGRSRGAVRGSD